MKFIYDFFIILAFIICQPLRLLSSKINLSYKGRRKSFKILKKEVDPNEKNIWFHVSSLGEFEIAKPIIETLEKSFDNIKIIVTFFSPSGYENSKEYRFADSKLYLPLDTSYNAKRFVTSFFSFSSLSYALINILISFINVLVIPLFVLIQRLSKKTIVITNCKTNTGIATIKSAL